MLAAYEEQDWDTFALLWYAEYQSGAELTAIRAILCEFRDERAMLAILEKINE